MDITQDLYITILIGIVLALGIWIIGLTYKKWLIKKELEEIRTDIWSLQHKNTKLQSEVGLWKGRFNTSQDNLKKVKTNLNNTKNLTGVESIKDKPKTNSKSTKSYPRHSKRQDDSTPGL